MDIATLASKLHALDLDITCIKKIDYGQQISLACGAVINVYDKGKTLANPCFRGPYAPISRR